MRQIGLIDKCPESWRNRISNHKVSRLFHTMSPTITSAVCQNQKQREPYAQVSIQPKRQRRHSSGGDQASERLSSSRTSYLCRWHWHTIRGRQTRVLYCGEEKRVEMTCRSVLRTAGPRAICVDDEREYLQRRRESTIRKDDEAVGGVFSLSLAGPRAVWCLQEVDKQPALCSTNGFARLCMLFIPPQVTGSRLAVD